MQEAIAKILSGPGVKKKGERTRSFYYRLVELCFFRAGIFFKIVIHGMRGFREHAWRKIERFDVETIILRTPLYINW